MVSEDGYCASEQKAGPTMAGDEDGMAPLLGAPEFVLRRIFRPRRPGH